ncbi:vesicle transport through interaction with t-SNAREs -like protein [Brachionus plicatilis]|uniref:Vesicle transport through interaction with t-SNAREs-like protein n=1 Tax=Brachionus plicatilis TaxID=10195 RepID=A0A3M7R6N0_BRAPC|nr:vesicle transport through interaction with t-SNAREs -like protein [Brachionus plicatilis]
MASDILRNYEQQFGVLCADITNKISTSANSSDKTGSITAIEGLFQEAMEIIEQMDLEIRDANSSKKRTQEQKDTYLNIINSYKGELSQLEKEFDRQVRNKSSKTGSKANFEIQLNENNPEDCELFELKQKNTESLNKMNRNLENGYKMVLESEETGNNILSDLFGQREQMQRARDRMREHYKTNSFYSG